MGGIVDRGYQKVQDAREGFGVLSDLVGFVVWGSDLTVVRPKVPE